MSESAFYHATVALAAGVAAQAIALRVGMPSIVVLLTAGVALGPEVLGVLEPAALGTGRGDLVTLGVTVILFEGALALDLDRLRQLQGPLVRLLTVGALVSMVGGALAARLLLDLSWSIALLYGAIMIVTGPTVVTPLLTRLTVARRVRELLVSEGVLIDPIGAIVALVTLEWVVGHTGVVESGSLVLVRLGTGALAGAAAGLGLAKALRRRWIAGELVNPVVLASVLLVAALASRVSAEAGLMAAVAQGMALANARTPEIGRLREFKEALTVILLSFLFVVLAAGLRLDDVRALGWEALAVVAVLAWVARPIAVALSTAGSDLGMRERAFVAWICPRGIVAVAVAGLFRILLEEAGVAGGPALEALVFVTVATTVLFQGVTAGPVAHALGIDVPSDLGVIVVGADRLGRLLAAHARQVVLVDRNPALCRAARQEGLTVYEGDALSPEALEAAGARWADTLVAVTRNPELNALVAQRVRENFRVERILALTEDGADGALPAPDGLFPGDFPGTDEVNRLVRLRRLRVVEHPVADGEAVGRRLAELPWGSREFALVLRHGDGAVVATGDQVLATGDTLVCVGPPDGRSDLPALLGSKVPPAP